MIKKQHIIVCCVMTVAFLVSCTPLPRAHSMSWSWAQGPNGVQFLVLAAGNRTNVFQRIGSQGEGSITGEWSGIDGAVTFDAAGTVCLPPQDGKLRTGRWQETTSQHGSISFD